MSAKITILGWKAIGLRCPDHEINLMNSNTTVYPVSLIQMPNGTGKTTTLNLIKAALSGSANEWDSKKINQFKKRDNSSNNALFEMKILLNDKKVTFQILFNFESGSVKYKTTHTRGQVDGFSPPKEFKKFLSENFVNFFVFDGELARNLLNEKYTNAENVIEHLFQIDHIKILKRSIEKYWDEETKGKTGVKAQGLKIAKDKLNKYNFDLIVYEQELAGFKKYEKIYKEDIDKRNKKYTEELQRSKDFGNKMNKLKDKIRKIEAEIQQISSTILDKMSDPTNLSINIASELQNFKNSLDKVKLPETAAREFFQELAEEEVCVCGRKIDLEIKTEILKRSDRYLGTDDVSLLNSIKSSINVSIDQSISIGRSDLDSLIVKLNETEKIKHNLQTELDEMYLNAEDEDPELEIIKNEIIKLTRSLTRVQEDMETYFDQYSNKNIENIKKQIEILKSSVLEKSQTYELNLKKTILHEILDKSHQSAKEHISKEICSEANDKIISLMPHNHIRIEKIDKSIRLLDQDGGSEGEQLSVAYAFLSTLFQRSSHSLPFVMDSPVGSIDGDIREEIATLIPKLANQFLAFTISTERQNFLKPLEKASNGEIQYLTLFRKGKAELPGNDKYIETDDGVLIEDKNYFNGFQVEKE